MKFLNLLAVAALAVYAVIALNACSQTSDSTPASTATCTPTSYGTYIVQRGCWNNGLYERWILHRSQRTASALHSRWNDICTTHWLSLYSLSSAKLRWLDADVWRAIRADDGEWAIDVRQLQHARQLNTPEFVLLHFVLLHPRTKLLVCLSPASLHLWIFGLWRRWWWIRRRIRFRGHS